MNAINGVLVSFLCASVATAQPIAQAVSYEKTKAYDCLVEAKQTVEIRSPVDGLIESISVNRGDLVRKGQLLVTLQSGAERAASDLAKARSEAQGELAAAQAKLQNTGLKEARNADLFKQNFVSAAALDDAKSEKELAYSQVTAARESLRVADLDYKRSNELLSMRQIRSPLTGVVVKRFLQPGEFAATNVKEPILRLAQIDPLHVEVLLPAKLFGNIKVGNKANVSPEAGIAQREATVSVVDRVIDGASGTFGVRLLLPNSDMAVPAGAKCQLQFK
jgi:RND family efflux transporter MFP subunit